MMVKADFQPAVTNPADQSDSDALSPDEIWKLLVAIGLHSHYNFHLRELVWYGLWTKELLLFMNIRSCFIFPQFPVWVIDDKDETASIVTIDPVTPKYLNRTPQSQVAGSSKGRTVDTSPFVPDISGISYPSTPPNQISKHYTPPSKVAFRGSPSPSSFIEAAENSNFVYKNLAQKRVRLFELEEELESLKPTKKVKEDIEIPGTHAVPDFGVVHIKYKRDTGTIYPFIKILGVVVPVLLEIKNYRYEEGSHESIGSQIAIGNGLTKAVTAMRKQVAYLLSSGDQSAVIAIAVTGYFWGWQHFIKKDGEIVARNYPNTLVGRIKDYHSQPAVTTKEAQRNGMKDWYGIFQIGTDESTVMLEKIRRWSSIFIMECNNTELDLEI